MISVDTKKKELVWAYKNTGREWHPEGEPEQVKVHDFIDPTVGKANPYGGYDVANNVGWVSVGTDHDTAAFAVETIRRWWEHVGRPLHPAATRLLICADGGGSNGYRTRLWKTELAKLATQAGLLINVAHLPPGTSKWNKIEHRLFSHISMNWRGRPLTSHEVIVQTIAATTTTHHGTYRPSRTGRHHLPQRPQNLRPRHAHSGNHRHSHPRRLPRRVELPAALATRDTPDLNKVN